MIQYILVGIAVAGSFAYLFFTFKKKLSKESKGCEQCELKQ